MNIYFLFTILKKYKHDEKHRTGKAIRKKLSLIVIFFLFCFTTLFVFGKLIFLITVRKLHLTIKNKNFLGRKDAKPTHLLFFD